MVWNIDSVLFCDEKRLNKKKKKKNCYRPTSK